MADKVIIQAPVSSNKTITITQPSLDGAIETPLTMVDEVIIKAPISSNSTILIMQTPLEETIKAFPIMKGEKGGEGPSGKSILELYQIHSGNLLATLEDYEAYLIAEPKANLNTAILDFENKIDGGFFTPAIEPQPQTRTWWVNGVDTNQPYLLSVEGSIDPQNFVYEQQIPSSVWTVNHPMNKFPSTTIIDSAGTQVVGEVIYLSLSEVQIIFSAAFSGKAILN